MCRRRAARTAIRETLRSRRFWWSTPLLWIRSLAGHGHGLLALGRLPLLEKERPQGRQGERQRARPAVEGEGGGFDASVVALGRAAVDVGIAVQDLPPVPALRDA